MENLARTVILSGNKDAKAILSIKGAKGEIRFFNMRQLPKSLAVGIRQRNKVSKFPLNVCGGVGEFDTKSKVNFDEPLFCAVVDVSNAFCPEMVLCSSGEKDGENREIETAFVQEKPKDRASLYEEQTQDEIENLIDQNLSDDMSCHYYDCCGKCKYKQAFYEEGNCEKILDKDENSGYLLKNKNEKCLINAENEKDVNSLKSEVFLAGQNDENLKQKNVEAKIFDEQNAEDDESKDNDGKKMFFEQIRPQIEILFSKYDRDENLEKLVPNSKWVKVNYEGGDECYELGVICDEKGKTEYICYGILSADEKNPPKSLEEYAKFLKLSAEEGLWVACQDAKTGETIKLDF